MITGYINEAGNLNMRRFEVFLGAIAEVYTVLLILHTFELHACVAIALNKLDGLSMVTTRIRAPWAP